MCIVSLTNSQQTYCRTSKTMGFRCNECILGSHSAPLKPPAKLTNFCVRGYHIAMPKTWLYSRRFPVLQPMLRIKPECQNVNVIIIVSC